MTIEISDDQKVAYRSVLANLKASIKADAKSIRSSKQQIRSDAKQGLSTSSMQSTLHSERTRARARLIVYGLCRGRQWGQIEPNRPEGDDSPRLKHAITLAWREANKDAAVPTPAALQPWILR